MLLEEIEKGGGNDTHVEPYYIKKTSFKDVQLTVGMKFIDHKQLGHAIKSPAVANELVITYLKNESNRVLAVGGYPDICK